MAKRLTIDAAWADAAWASRLEWTERAAYVEFLRWVALHGRGGVARAVDTDVIARDTGAPAASVAKAVAAALRGGAVSLEGGRWKVADWPREAADRTRRWRERSGGGSVAGATNFEPESPEDVTSQTPCDVTSGSGQVQLVAGATNFEPASPEDVTSQRRKRKAQVQLVAGATLFESEDTNVVTSQSDGGTIVDNPPSSLPPSTPLPTKPPPRSNSVAKDSLTPPVPKGTSPPLSTEWWRLEPEGSTARLIAETIAATVMRDGRAAYPDQPAEEAVRKIAAQVEAIEPPPLPGAERELELLLATWLETHAGRIRSAKGGSVNNLPYKQPLRGLQSWLRVHESNWRRLAQGRTNGGPARQGLATMAREAAKMLDEGP